MAADIYEEAVADAKKLREKTRQVVEQQLVETFRPKIDQYIEQALLEAGGEDAEEVSDEEDEDILLGVDLGDEGVADQESGDQIARDVEASIEGGEDGESAALQINSDGTVTLDLDKVIVPEESADNVEVGPVEPGAAPIDTADAGAGKLMAGEVKEWMEKLDALKQIAESVDDKGAAFGKLVSAFDKITFSLAPSDFAKVDRVGLMGLTELAERINDSYVYVRESGSIDDDAKAGLCEKLEGTYARVNNILVEAVCSRVARKLTQVERGLFKSRRLNETARKKRGNTFYRELDGMCKIVEAVVDRTRSAKAERLKGKIVALVKEIKKMTNKRSPLNEEEVVLKLELPDDEAKEKVLAALGGGEEDLGDLEDFDDEGGGEEDLDALLGGGEEEEDGDGLELESSSVADELARLFEADDEEEGDAELSLGDLGDEEEGDEGGEEEGAGDKVASELEAIAGVLRDVEGDVEIELVDDEEEGGEEDAMLDLDLGGEEEEGGEEEDELDLGESEYYMEADEADEDALAEEDDAEEEEIVEVDMRDIAMALREMDSTYHAQDMPGPEAGLDDFGGATESGEAFVDNDDEVEDVKTEARRRRARRISEGRRRPSKPSAREVAALRKQLTEAKRKQSDSNLLSAKLLYTNKLLQRNDLSESQKSRIIDAMDEAGNLREARLLYKNLTRAIERRRGRLSEGRHQPVGSASQVTTSGGFNRGAVDSNNSTMLNESIDIDYWKKHAGLD